MAKFYKKDKTVPELKIITFSGEEGATKNMTVYECGDDIIVIDVGVEFADEDLPGVDVVIPDFTYLVENQERIRGVFVTHAHEDHLGAIPYLLRELDVPIYANPLVQEFIKKRLNDKASKNIVDNVSFHLIGADVDPVTVGNFTVSTFKVNHSVPTSLGICIETPQGRILHMADYKIDFSPVIDDPIDIATISRYGDEGVLCLLSDCLGADHEGHSKSEQTMKDIFHELFEQAEGRQILVTTISSNISRMHQITEAAIKNGRKVALGGRSIANAVEIAQNLGMLPFDSDVFLTERQAAGYDPKAVVYIIAGCFGQSGSALERVSRQDNKNIHLEENAMVIFSADPSPPGTRVPVERMMNRLTLLGGEVIYSRIQDNLHVSGHGPREDLRTIAAIVKPKYFIPIGGNITQSRAYRNMVGELGVEKERVFELLEGDNVIFDNGKARLGERLETKQVLVDGTKVGEVGEMVIRDREHLSTDGVFVVVVPISKSDKSVKGGVEVITRGFIYVKESKQLMGQAKDLANKIIDREDTSVQNWGSLQNMIEKEISKFLNKETGRRPMVIVHSISV